MFTIDTTPDRRRKMCATSLVVAILLSLAGSASAAITQFWAGPGGTTNAPVSGTWTNGVGTGTFWSDGAIDTGNSTWTNGNSAFFGGVDGAYGIRVGGAISMVSARFSASGYTLTNNVVSTISASTASQSLIVDAGKTATIGTNVTVSFTTVSTVKINSPSTAGGTLVVENGGIVQQTVNGNLSIVGSNTDRKSVV